MGELRYLNMEAEQWAVDNRAPIASSVPPSFVLYLVAETEVRQEQLDEYAYHIEMIGITEYAMWGETQLLDEHVLDLIDSDGPDAAYDDFRMYYSITPSEFEQVKEQTRQIVREKHDIEEELDLTDKIER